MNSYKSSKCRSIVFIAMSLLAFESYAKTSVNCRVLLEDTVRLSCYDEYLGSPNAAALKQPDASEFGKEQLPRSEIKTSLTIIVSTIKAIRKQARGEFVFDLANGQTWAQIEYKFSIFREDDAVTIRKSRVGGYMLTSGRGTSTRVKRLS